MMSFLGGVVKLVRPYAALGARSVIRVTADGSVRLSSFSSRPRAWLREGEATPLTTL